MIGHNQTLNSNGKSRFIVYDRSMHFCKSIESLRKNKDAEDTTLYLCSDGLKDKRCAIFENVKYL